MDTSNIQLQHLPLPFQSEVELYVLRLDLLDQIVSGNKWFKLKHNIHQASLLNKKGIITFGGAYSNHIAATAMACRNSGIDSIGVIRGEEVNNHTISEARKNGMQLRFVSRSLYKNKTALHEWLNETYAIENFLLVPEGGANNAGMEGCMEIAQLIEVPFDLIALSCGTGTTLAGVANSINEQQQVIGFAALKGGNFLYDVVKSFLPAQKHHQFEIIEDFHFGGYAKYNSELLRFMREFKARYLFELDFVYTAKMMYGLFYLIEKKYFSGNKKIVAIHSGGLQGNLSIDI